jgi:thiamine-phosphate pyrophosphorylase
VQGRLYLVVTPRPGWSFAETLDRTERALAGGVEVLQLRAKDWEARPILELGERMRALAERYGVPFFVNDRPDLAALLGADGVHLGQNDLTPPEARRFFRGRVGRSTHAPEQALRALEEGGGLPLRGAGVGDPHQAGAARSGPRLRALGGGEPGE